MGLTGSMDRLLQRLTKKLQLKTQVVVRVGDGFGLMVHFMPSGHCTEACYKLTAVDHLWRFSNKIRCCWFLCWPIGQICLQKRFIFLTCQEKPICSSFLTTKFSVANNFFAFNFFFFHFKVFTVNCLQNNYIKFKG